ncbi:MAG: sulfatase-like hydrolase/transferase [Thermoplasmatota archaeon]
MMKRPDIYLIILDTLRKDFSANIEGYLENQGFRKYEKAYATSSWTIPTHASIMTGEYPSSHGAHETLTRKGFDIRFKGGKKKLNILLKDMGYRTFLFSANPFITQDFGYDSFDFYFEKLYNKTPRILNKKESKKLYELRKSEVTTVKMIGKLARTGQLPLLAKGMINRIGKSGLSEKLYTYYQGKVKGWPHYKGIKEIFRSFRENVVGDPSKKPKFVMINIMEVHDPYYLKPFIRPKLTMNDRVYKKEMTEEKRMDLISKYKDQVDLIRVYIEKFISLLEQRGMIDDSVIIITSDHGQLLGEYGQLGHGRFLYDELVHVPLMIRYPGNFTSTDPGHDDRAVSLLKLYNFIISAARGEGSYDGSLYEDTVFAESYGMILDFKPEEEIERRKMEALERYQVFICHKGNSAIFDVKEWDFIDIGPVNDRILEEEEKVMLKKEIVKFLSKQETGKIKKIRFDQKI